MIARKPRPKPLVKAPAVPLIPFPSVSVLITAHNAVAFLAEAVTSVLRQAPSIATEILLVDDGSTDGTSELAEALQLQHPARLRVLRHPGRRNCGISASRNLALEHARAPVIALLDADDVWLPWRLDSQLPLLDKNPRVPMLYAQAERWVDHNLPFSRLIGSIGRNFTPPLMPAGQRPGIVPPGRLLSWFLADESFTPCTCTVLVRTEVARSLGGFVAPFTGLYDDQVFYSKLALEHPVLVSTEVVARYRQHPASCCATNRDTPAQATARDRFLSWLNTYRAERQLPLHPDVSALLSSATPEPELLPS